LTLKKVTNPSLDLNASVHTEHEKMLKIQTRNAKTLPINDL